MKNLQNLEDGFNFVFIFHIPYYLLRMERYTGYREREKKEIASMFPILDEFSSVRVEEINQKDMTDFSFFFECSSPKSCFISFASKEITENLLIKSIPIRYKSGPDERHRDSKSLWKRSTIHFTLPNHASIQVEKKGHIEQ